MSGRGHKPQKSAEKTGRESVSIFFLVPGVVNVTPPGDFQSLSRERRLEWARGVLAEAGSEALLSAVADAVDSIPEISVACVDETDTGRILAGTELWDEYRASQGTLPGYDKKEILRAVEVLGEGGAEEGALDEAVHDIASGEASSVNNAGFQAQAEYIARKAGTKELTKAVADATR